MEKKYYPWLPRKGIAVLNKGWNLLGSPLAKVLLAPRALLWHLELVVTHRRRAAAERVAALPRVGCSRKRAASCLFDANGRDTSVLEARMCQKSKPSFGLPIATAL